MNYCITCHNFRCLMIELAQAMGMKSLQTHAQEAGIWGNVCSDEDSLVGAGRGDGGEGIVYFTLKEGSGGMCALMGTHCQRKCWGILF